MISIEALDVHPVQSVDVIPSQEAHTPCQAVQVKTSVASVSRYPASHSHALDAFTEAFVIHVKQSLRVAPSHVNHEAFHYTHSNISNGLES